MPAVYTAPMPDTVELGGSWTIRLTALDPTTGAVVSGVKVKQLVVSLVAEGDLPLSELAFGPYQLLPGPGA